MPSKVTQYLILGKTISVKKNLRIEYHDKPVTLCKAPFKYPEKNNDPLRGHSKVKRKGIKGLWGKAPDTPNRKCVELVAVALSAAIEVLEPREVRIELGRTPVRGAGETTDGAAISVETVELA